jgi:hypothetical protein
VQNKEAIEELAQTLEARRRSALLSYQLVRRHVNVARWRSPARDDLEEEVSSVKRFKYPAELV